MEHDIRDTAGALNCGKLTLDASRNMHNVNTVLTEWTGRTAEEMEDKDLRKLLTRGSLLYWESTIEPLLENQGFAWDVSLELSSNHQAKVAVLINARRTEGRTDCLFFPFTDRRKYELQSHAAKVHARRHKSDIDRIEELNQFRRGFVNVAAHELATPLTPLQIQLHLLKTNLGDDVDPKIRHSLDTMQTNLDKLSKFSSALISSANIDAGRIGLSMSTVDAAHFVPKMVNGWKERFARNRDITVEVEPAIIEADLDALRTCLTNLLENAVKFSPPDSAIRVRVSAGPPGSIVVEDLGRGIDRDRLQELGRPFVQLHDNQDVTALGVGLGLHIVNGLMKAQGGKLHLHSDGPGEGTQATLEFASAADEPEESVHQ